MEDCDRNIKNSDGGLELLSLSSFIVGHPYVRTKDGKKYFWEL